MAGFKVKITYKFDTLKDLKKNISDDDLLEAGQAISTEIKELIASGQSPVDGQGRFTQYAVNRGRGPNAYPRSVQKTFPDKTITPVNLSLNGSYMSKYTHWVSKTKSMFLGFKDPNAKTIALFEAHNLGLNTKKGVPMRKHLPDAKGGETFTAAVRLEIVRQFTKIVDNVIKKSRKG